MSHLYCLNDDHSVAPIEDVATWGRWMEDADRTVELTVGATWRVSTMFLGIDYCWLGGEPILFETMTFGGPRAGEMLRYHSWDEAVIGHRGEVEATLRAIAGVNAIAIECGAVMR
jgi:hypothetical protein